jgi:hypothetical protein
VLTPTLADTHHNPAVAARMLARYESKPGRQKSAILEVGTITDRRYYRGCRLWSDPRIFAILWQTSLASKIASIFRSKGPDALVDLEHQDVQP